MTRVPILRMSPRQIRFNSLNFFFLDAERIYHANQVERLGNWTPGRAFEHLAKSFGSSIRESKAVFPLWNRAIAKLFKPLLLRYGLPSGVRIESFDDIAAREFLPSERVTDKEGLRELQQVITELSAHEMHAKHNLFGKMSPRDWERMHCRHAELHLRLLIPKDSSAP